MPYLQVVSWNIELGLRVEAAIDALTTRRELADFDVLLAQELDGRGADRIAEALGCSVTYASTGIHPKTGRSFGNAVITRLPILVERSFSLPQQARFSGFPRGAVGAQVAIGSDRLWCYATHTEIPFMARSRRLAQFAEIVGEASTADLPAVVGGDFNTATWVARRDLRHAMARGGFEPLLPSEPSTLRRFGLTFRLDHLFGRRVEPMEWLVSPGSPASDHCPIGARIRL